MESKGHTEWSPPNVVLRMSLLSVSSELCINFLLRKAFGSRCLVLSAVRFVEKPLALEPTNCAAAHAFIAPGLKPWEDHPGSQQSRSLIFDCVALFVVCSHE